MEHSSALRCVQEFVQWSSGVNKYYTIESESGSCPGVVACTDRYYM